jgi:restriction system protein
MPPAGFERLAQRLLREAGFISATVMGRSGGGGIDGLGVYRLSLVSFPVYFQCKRYRGSVGPAVVRDFRGAMAGRGDKGRSSPRTASPATPSGKRPETGSRRLT